MTIPENKASLLDEIETDFIEARKLRGLFIAVREGNLAPVFDIKTPEIGFYTSRIHELSKEIDWCIRSLGGVAVRYLDETDDRIKSADIAGSFFEISTGILHGFVANSDSVQPFEPENIARSFNDTPKPFERKYLPIEVEPQELLAAQRQKYLSELKKSWKKEKIRRSGLRRIK